MKEDILFYSICLLWHMKHFTEVVAGALILKFNTAAWWIIHVQTHTNNSNYIV